MAKWLDRLSQLPLLSMLDGITSELTDEQCIEGNEGSVHYIGTRQDFELAGPMYMISLSGPDADREELIREISRELGKTFEINRETHPFIWYIYWLDRRSKR